MEKHNVKDIELLLASFPEARLVKKGLNNNKWETEHYIFCLPCLFYTNKKTKVTVFVKKGWKIGFENLKNAICPPSEDQ